MQSGGTSFILALRHTDTCIQCFIVVCGSLWSTDHKSKFGVPSKHITYYI